MKLAKAQRLLNARRQAAYNHIIKWLSASERTKEKLSLHEHPVQ